MDSTFHLYPQEFFLVYEFRKSEMKFTFPIGGESLAAARPETIRWDAPESTEKFKLEYSADGGATWTQLSGALPATTRQYPWNVPSNVASGNAFVRLTRGNEVVQNEKLFYIMRQPDDLEVQWACPNSFNFSWDPVNEAVAYEVSLLGEKFMDSVGVTTATNATVYANTSEEQWVSVKAFEPDGAIGKRAIALRKNPGQFGCTLSPPIADITVSCEAVGLQRMCSIQ